MPPSSLLISQMGVRGKNARQLSSAAKSISLRKRRLAKTLNNTRRVNLSKSAVKLSKRELAKIAASVNKMVTDEIGSLRRSARIATRKNKNKNAASGSLSKSDSDKIVKVATKKTLALAKNSLPLFHPSVFEPNYAELKKKYDATWKKYLNSVKSKKYPHGQAPRENTNVTVNALANTFDRVVKGSYYNSRRANNNSGPRHHLHRSKLGTHSAKRGSNHYKSRMRTIAENANENSNV